MIAAVCSCDRREASWTSTDHIGCHRSLAGGRPVGRPNRSARVDAVVVPSARARGRVDEAARVAARHGSHLVVLCSGDADPDATVRSAARFVPAARLLVAALPRGWASPDVLRFGADETPQGLLRRADTGLKRNLGLVLARRVGWARVLFVDDDIVGLTARHVRTAASALGSGARSPDVVGWAFDGFPDNSLVDHAYRLTGGRQCTFIGGGALAVRLTDRVGYFPRIYNEDWMFMAAYLRRRRAAVMLAGLMWQRTFDPFARAGDAALQEFGDLAAEGLFRLLHEPRGALRRARDATWWAEELDRRRTFVRDVRARLDPVRQEPAWSAVDVALEVLDQRAASWPGELADWTTRWSDDLARWPADLARLPPARSAGDAAADLGLEVHGAPAPGVLRSVGRSVRQAVSRLPRQVAPRGDEGANPDNVGRSSGALQ